MASSSAPESFPPHYIFVSQGSLPAAGGAGQSTLTAPVLTFPIIHYHYADDPPLSLIPSKDRDNQPHIILDYDPASGQPPVVRSVSEGLAVTGIKVTDAPGVIKGVAKDKNPNMFVIEAVSTSTTHRPGNNVSSEAQNDWLLDPSGTISRFKQRNTILREALEYQSYRARDNLVKGEQSANGHFNLDSMPEGAIPSSFSSPETMKNMPLAPS